MTQPGPSDTGLRCPKCGYNLTGMTSSICPECGERFIVTNAQGYRAKFPPSQARQFLHRAWLIGTVVIVMSWFRLVPPQVGWLGFIVSGGAWLLLQSAKR